MEIVEFRKVLSKALDMVDVGIKMGYFDSDRAEELNNKLVLIFRNGVEYDLPGTAVYGMYKPSERKLYFNAKVFKNDEEALVYILHEIKHGLDHYGDVIGFEDNDKGVGINEGATQRFATDMAEEILQTTIPRKTQSSLGVQLNTHLDEYQIEDKLNELFCLVMGISIKEFIKIQNDPQKKGLQELINKFNQYADYSVFSDSLDEIYNIQTETWFDEYGNLLEKEKEPTENQTRRAVELINRCKQELIKYARKNNVSVVDRIEEESFVAIDEHGHIIRSDGAHVLDEEVIREPMSDDTMLNQEDYIKYQQRIISQINSDIINNECSVIFVTEFKYEQDMDDKIVFFRKGNLYFKIIIPVLDDMTLDLANVTVQKVDDLNEIIEAIKDCESNFGVIANAHEYAEILKIIGESEKSKEILDKWDYYLSKQNELEAIRKKHEEGKKATQDFMASMRASIESEPEQPQQSYWDKLFNKEIRYGNIIINENEISIVNPDGTVTIVPDDQKQDYIMEVRNAVESGELTLTIIQSKLLDSYSNGDSPKTK